MTQPRDCISDLIQLRVDLLSDALLKGKTETAKYRSDALKDLLSCINYRVESDATFNAHADLIICPNCIKPWDIDDPECCNYYKQVNQ